LNIEVERWEGYPPEEIKESHVYQEIPQREYLEFAFGESIVKDRDFRMFSQPLGTYWAKRWDRESHQEEVQRERMKWKKAALRAAARPEPAARPPPKTTLEQDVEDEAKQMSADPEFKKKMEKAPSLKKPKRK
jgi:hypothetical protein